MPTIPETSSETMGSEATAWRTATKEPPQAATRISRRTHTNITPEEQEQSVIVRVMNVNTSNALGQRRMAFYDHRYDTLIDRSAEGEPAASSESADGSERDEEDSQDNISNADLMEHNYAHFTNNELSQNIFFPPFASNEDSGPYIMIKLKYINDDLMLVAGRLQESVGEFKRRHFETELKSNKSVRLIFNGKALGPDESSLKNCGLSDNCVVHCLIHKKRPSPMDAAITDYSDDFIRRNRRQRIPQMNNNNNNQGRDSDLGNILFVLISIILGSAWYFRYVYAHLYTITATVALTIVTGIFSVVVISMYFPDEEAIPETTENEQR